MTGGKESARPTDLADEHEATHGGDAMEAAIDRRKAITEIAAQLSPARRAGLLSVLPGRLGCQSALGAVYDVREITDRKGS